MLRLEPWVNIGMACAEMGISEKAWREMESYQIAKEQA